MIFKMFSFKPSSMDIMKMSLFLLLLLPPMVLSACTCDVEDTKKHDKSLTLKYKIDAIFAILIAGAVGICVPLVSQKFSALSHGNKDLFFTIKAFASGVILSTVFIHLLPDAFENLTSPCLNPNPWQKFPFTGFIAMMAAIITLMLNSFAISYKRVHYGNYKLLKADEESTDDHPTINSQDQGMSELIHRVLSQVLEFGMVVHSIIIGMSLGASESLSTIKPLIGALCFHQFFEGKGLGDYISQAKFKSLSTLIMVLVFPLTTPLGIATGIGISSGYDESCPTSLIVEGCFNAAASGVLIYMALVDLLAANFMNARMQSNVRLQLVSYVSLLLGAGYMAILAKKAK